MFRKNLIIIIFVIFITECKSQDDCGTHQILSPKIFKGALTVDGEHPWKAALILNGEYHCGGSLVSNKMVVTAAHCIEGKQNEYIFEAKDIKVMLGAHNLLNSSETDRIIAKVKSIHVHPDWNVNHDSYDGDIAVLILDKTIRFRRNIQPVCLTKPRSRAARANEGVAIGFGFTENRMLSSIAKKLKMPLVNFHNCVKDKTVLKQLLSARLLCGGLRDGSGVCTGDSGSGLYVSFNNKFYLRGIVSSSPLNSVLECDVNQYGIFVDATEYCGWIKSGGVDQYATCSEDDSISPSRTPRPTRPKTTPKPIRNTLYADQYLNANEYLESTNKCFKVYYQGDGNFVVYRASSMQHTWHSQTHGTCTKYAYMQADGNFVVYDCNHVAKWHSHTHGHPGARIVIQDDGNLVVYSPNNVALWNSQTVTHC